MFSIPNCVMLTEEQRMQLHRLFSAVESTPEFHESAAKQWSVDGAEMASNLDVYRTFVESGQRRKQDWANALRDAISAVPLLAVFGLCVRDRDGLEQSPKHVVGRHLTFFVDARTATIVFMIKGIYSE